MLSWPIKGITLALDFPQNKFSETLFQSLNHISQKYKGKIYPAKDAQVGAKFFKEINPKWEELEKYREPCPEALVDSALRNIKILEDISTFW